MHRTSKKLSQRVRNQFVFEASFSDMEALYLINLLLLSYARPCLGHINLMFCFTSKPTHYFAILTLKYKLVGVAIIFVWYCGGGPFCIQGLGSRLISCIYMISATSCSSNKCNGHSSNDINILYFIYPECDVKQYSSVPLTLSEPLSLFVGSCQGQTL